MLIKETFSITVHHIFGQGDDTPDKLMEFYKKTWEELIENYSEFIFETEDELITVSIDWGSVPRKIRSIETMSGKVKLVITLTTDSSVIPYNSRQYMSHFLGLVLHDIFLTANLSAPGCLDFYMAKYRTSNPKSKDRFIHEIPYSSLFLEWAWAELLEKYQWSTISRIPLSQVIQWHKSLGIQTRQIAQEPIERALFALIHFCSGTYTSPHTLLWLMHALEAMYDTPKEGISQALRRRIELVLGEPKTHKQVIRKEFNKLYDVRSAFVHGTFDIHHPVMNERLDANLDEYTNDFIEKYIFACIIVMATLQYMILHNQRELVFEEILVADVD